MNNLSFPNSNSNNEALVKLYEQLANIQIWRARYQISATKFLELRNDLLDQIKKLELKELED